MSNIQPQPQGPSPVRREFALADAKTVSASALSMALAMLQMELLQQTLASRFAHAHDRLRTLNEVAPLAADVTTARDLVIQQELQSADGQIASLQMVSSRHVDNLTVNATDNERFEELSRWATERGVTFESMTRVVPPPSDEAATAEGAAGPTPTDEAAPETPPTIVLDQEAVARNLATLQAYRAQVQEGTADNAAIRTLVASAPGLRELQAQVDEHLGRGSWSTLADLDGKSVALDALRHSLANSLQGDLAGIRVLGSDLLQKSQEFDQLVRSGTQREARNENLVDERANDQQRRDLVIERRTAQEEFVEEVNQTLRLAEAALDKHQAIASQHNLTRERSDAVFSRLTDSQRQQADQQFSSWKSELDRQLDEPFVSEPDQELGRSIQA